MHTRAPMIIAPRTVRTVACIRSRAVAHRARPTPAPRLPTIKCSARAAFRLHRSCCPPRRGISTATAAALTAAAAQVAPAAVVVPAGLWAWSRYQVAPENEYLVRTGSEWNNIKITKRGFVWPFQTHFFLQLQPREYPFEMPAVCYNKVEFFLCGVLTFGPKDTPDALLRFVKVMLLSEQGCNYHHLLLIDGILEHQLRRISEQLAIEQISSASKAYSGLLQREMQKELDEFGVHLYGLHITEVKHPKRVAKVRQRPPAALQTLST